MNLDPQRTLPGGNRTIVVAAACLGLFVVGVISRADLTEGLAAAFLTACAVISGWALGLRLSAAVVALAVALDFAHLPSLSFSHLLPFTLRWGIACALLVAIARVRALLESERRQARIDSLTGLPNRAAFFERGEMEFSRARRSEQSVTLMLLDGDGFKAVNDRRGHAGGDRALQETAAALREAVRAYDLVCRLGGDEFAILLPQAAAADAAKIAVRIQRALTARLTDFGPLTYCIGVATFAAPANDLAICLKKADEALYSAKRRGKCSIEHAVV